MAAVDLRQGNTKKGTPDAAPSQWQGIINRDAKSGADPLTHIQF
jgi:hypothetical protein